MDISSGGIEARPAAVEVQSGALETSSISSSRVGVQPETSMNATGALIKHFEALTEQQQQHKQRQVNWIATDRAGANLTANQVDRTTVDHKYGVHDHGVVDRRYVPHSAAMGNQIHKGLILAQAAATVAGECTSGSRSSSSSSICSNSNGNSSRNSNYGGSFSFVAV